MTQAGRPRETGGYLHGYTPEEAARLRHQARFLEPGVFRDIDMRGRSRLLEPGCGVGAQTSILLERYPELEIDSVDLQDGQLTHLRSHLSPAIAAGRLRVHQADARTLPFTAGSFDSAFLCWFLEHVPEPVAILREIRRCLKPGAVLYCTEVMNPSLFVHPRSEALAEYWSLYNRHQSDLGGDPDVGAKLGNLLHEAGYPKIRIDARTELRDSRDPAAREAFFSYWTDLLRSGAPGLEAAGKLPTGLLARLELELAEIRRGVHSLFSYTWYQARAEV